MTDIPKVTAVFQTTLASGITATATSFTLVGNLDKAGNPLSGYYGFVLDEGNEDEEFFLVTIAGTVATVVRRGIDPTNPETEVTELKKRHRRGAVVKATNYPILGLLRAILNGDGGFALPNLIGYASDLTPSADSHFATKKYVDEVGFGGSLTIDRMVVPATGGETIEEDEWVYFDETDGEWKLASAATAGTSVDVMIGKAMGAGTDGNSISGGVMLMGVAENQDGAAGDIAYLSDTPGEVSSTPGTIERAVGVFKSATEVYLDPYLKIVPTSNEKAAMAGGDEFGEPSDENMFVTEEKLQDARTKRKQIRVFIKKTFGGSTTQFDITKTGDTVRYTYDGTGTNPVINDQSVPVGAVLNINAQNFHATNKGVFTVTASGDSYFEIINASGTAESNKTIGTGSITGHDTWTKPSGLLKVVVKVVGGGGGSAGLSGTSSFTKLSATGAGGGYAEKELLEEDLGSTEEVSVGDGGAAGPSGNNAASPGEPSSFGSHVSATPGNGGGTSTDSAATPGNGVNGDMNIPGGVGMAYKSMDSGDPSSISGGSFLRPGLPAVFDLDSSSRVTYWFGAGAPAALTTSSSNNGGRKGAPGIVIVEEYFI